MKALYSTYKVFLHALSENINKTEMIHILSIAAPSYWWHVADPHSKSPNKNIVDSNTECPRPSCMTISDYNLVSRETVDFKHHVPDSDGDDN